MGSKKKATKKTKSKSKKTSPPTKHVEEKDVPITELSDNELNESTKSIDEGHVTDEMESIEIPPDSTSQESPETAEEADQVDELNQNVHNSSVESKFKGVPPLHSQVARLRSEEGGTRNFSRKLSLQVQDTIVEPPKKLNTRRISLVDNDNFKHPLKDCWTFWYYMGNKFRQWSENLKRVCELSSVEEFWGLERSLIKPSQLSPGKDFSFFKKHIRPEWEDPVNFKGGMWSVCPKDRNQKSSSMDKAWEEILLTMIGDQFEHQSCHVNGVTFSKRKNQDRISLWIGLDLNRSEDILEIGHMMKRALSIISNQSFKLEFATSEDWRNKSGSTVTTRFTL